MTAQRGTAMRVGVDFHVADGKYQGSRTHVIELFAKMIELAPEIEFVLFLDKPEALRPSSAAFRSANVTLVRMPAANPVRRVFWQLPRLCRQFGIDILHTQYMLPWPLACRRVVTIHDVLFETHPQYFTRLMVWRSRWLIRRAARAADHVFTVSDFSRTEIERLYGVPSGRVTVIPNGVDLARLRPGKSGQSRLLSRGLVAGQYLLSVGRLEPRKNHLALIEAYASLPATTPPLVIVGQRDFHYEHIHAAAERLGIGRRVIFFEDVDDVELACLYRHARLFVYPAWAEGFGMPPLEAMASGVAVVTSSTTALREVVGDIGCVVDPGDVAALARTMQHLLNDDEDRARRGNRGRRHAEGFTWERSAERALQVYRRLQPDRSRPSTTLALVEPLRATSPGGRR